jgi:signal transduction histidine kinase
VSAAKSQFAATVSHEVRRPINAVLGYTEMLASENKGPLTSGQRGYVEHLRTQAPIPAVIVFDEDDLEGYLLRILKRPLSATRRRISVVWSSGRRWA